MKKITKPIFLLSFALASLSVLSSTEGLAQSLTRVLCQNSKSLRVAERRSCLRGERIVTRRGLQGPRGAQGEVGPQGPAGLGVQGAQGPQGNIGPVGPVGGTGATGATGAFGGRVYMGYIASLNSANTEYFYPVGVSANTVSLANIADAQEEVDRDCTVGKLRVVVSNPPGTGADRTFEIAIGATGTGVSCTILHNETSCSSHTTGATGATGATGPTANVQALDLLSISSTASGSPVGSVNAYFSFICEETHSA